VMQALASKRASNDELTEIRRMLERGKERASEGGDEITSEVRDDRD